MQSRLDGTRLFLPLLGRVAVACAALGCSGGAPAVIPARSAAQPTSHVVTKQPGSASVEPALHPPTASSKPRAFRALVAGRVRQLDVAALTLRRATAVVQETNLRSFNVLLQCGASIPCPTAKSDVLGWVQLDEHALRPYLLGRPVTSLLNEDEEIAPGEHVLFAALLTPDKIYADAASFRVESARRSPPSSRLVAPQLGAAQSLAAAQPPTADETAVHLACFLLLPEPTVNGQSAQTLEMLAVLVDVHGIDRAVESEPTKQGEQDVMVHYTARGEGEAARGSFLLGTSAIFERPPQGDLQIEVSCERGGKELARSERTVTLNPELTGVKK